MEPLINDNINMTESELSTERNTVTRYEKGRCSNKRWILLPLFLFPWFAGFLNAITVVVIKGVTNVIATEKEFHHNFKHPLTYVLILLAPLSIVSELLMFNHSLKYFDMSKVTPIFRGSVVINSILFGGIIYEEFFKFSTL